MQIYAARESGDIAIWRRDLPAGRAVKLVERVEGKLGDLAFTDHGASIQFVTFPPKNPGSRSVSIAHIAGGPVVQLSQKFPGPVSLDMAGRQSAFYAADLDGGADELSIADLKTGAKRILTSYKYPLRFTWNSRPAWSSDGKQIAYAAEVHDKKGSLVRLWIVDTVTGRGRAVFSPRRQWVQSTEWTNKDSALVVVGQEHESSSQQIWYLSSRGTRGATRRIGNELDDYLGASVTASGSEIVSVQSQTLSQ